MTTRAILALIAFLSAAQAQAAVLEYEFWFGRTEACVGMNLPSKGWGCWRSGDFRRAGVRPPVDPRHFERPPAIRTFTIDEGVLGRSVADSTISVQHMDPYSPEFAERTGVVNGFLTHFVYYQSLSITFGPNREILSLYADILDGPPDWKLWYRVMPDGSISGNARQDYSFFGGPDPDEWFYFETNARIERIHLRSIDGVLQPSPLPLPAGVLLLGAALGGLALLRRRRG